MRNPYLRNLHSGQSNIKVDGQIKNQPVAQARKKLNLRFVLSEIDKPFFILIMVLLVFGITMMFSASFATAKYEEENQYYYLNKQLLFAAVGMGGMLLASAVDYHLFQNTKVAYGSFLVTWIVTFFTSIFGRETAGAKRWIPLGPFSLQPSEVLKIAYIIIIAYILAVNFPKFKKWSYSIVPTATIMGLVFLVLVLQRHLSAVMIVGFIGIAMMFVGEIPNKKLFTFLGICALIVGLAALVLVFVGVDKFSYLSTRFQSWQDPMSDISGETAQTYQGLLAIGSGGWFGLGLGNSRQKFLYLPESQNDFIFSIICEELGFVGAMTVIILFVIFVLRGFYIAVRAKDRFGMLLVVGIVTQIAMQAFLNIAVACNAFPNTGISLPFFSYGGTALIFQMAEIGVLLSVSRQSNLKK